MYLQTWAQVNTQISLLPQSDKRSLISAQQNLGNQRVPSLDWSDCALVQADPSLTFGFHHQVTLSYIMYHQVHYLTLCIFRYIILHYASSGMLSYIMHQQLHYLTLCIIRYIILHYASSGMLSYIMHHQVIILHYASSGTLSCIMAQVTHWGQVNSPTTALCSGLFPIAECPVSFNDHTTTSL